jgi:YD repeat-containing protein
VGGILGAGAKNTGGWQLTTSAADGCSTIDKTDYFNLLSWHQDQGAHTYSYTYDDDARLISQTSSAGQNIQYAYYANGNIKESKDLANQMLSRYGYDNAGHRVWEAYSGLAADNASPDVTAVYQDSDQRQFLPKGRSLLRFDQVEVDEAITSSITDRENAWAIAPRMRSFMASRCARFNYPLMHLSLNRRMKSGSNPRATTGVLDRFGSACARSCTSASSGSPAARVRWPGL